MYRAWMFTPFSAHTTGLAAPSALQSLVTSKPKNSSLAISKPQEGQFLFCILPSVFVITPLLPELARFFKWVI